MMFDKKGTIILLCILLIGCITVQNQTTDKNTSEENLSIISTGENASGVDNIIDTENQVLVEGQKIKRKNNLYFELVKINLFENEEKIIVYREYFEDLPLTYNSKYLFSNGEFQDVYSIIGGTLKITSIDNDSANLIIHDDGNLFNNLDEICQYGKEKLQGRYSADELQLKLELASQGYCYQVPADGAFNSLSNENFILQGEVTEEELSQSLGLLNTADNFVSNLFPISNEHNPVTVFVTKNKANTGVVGDSALNFDYNHLFKTSDGLNSRLPLIVHELTHVITPKLGSPVLLEGLATYADHVFIKQTNPSEPELTECLENGFKPGGGDIIPYPAIDGNGNVQNYQYAYPTGYCLWKDIERKSGTGTINKILEQYQLQQEYRDRTICWKEQIKEIIGNETYEYLKDKYGIEDFCQKPMDI